jgi:hypothetical protein
MSRMPVIQFSMDFPLFKAGNRTETAQNAFDTDLSPASTPFNVFFDNTSNSTLLKVHVSNGYHNDFWRMLKHGSTQGKTMPHLRLLNLQISQGKCPLF